MRGVIFISEFGLGRARVQSEKLIYSQIEKKKKKRCCLRDNNGVYFLKVFLTFMCRPNIVDSGYWNTLVLHCSCKSGCRS